MSSGTSILAKSKWTMTHGFYAGMGGYVIDLDSTGIESGPTFIPQASRLTLTPRGVHLLAECGLLPEVSKEEIEDKSKTDGIGKFLSCLQAGWMLVQVVDRLVLDLPVTLLEVNTIGHVLCALAIYVLWWDKPRWIQEPTRVEGEHLRRVCAFMYMSSQISGEKKRNQKVILRDFRGKSEMSALAFRPTKQPDPREAPSPVKDMISELKHKAVSDEQHVHAEADKPCKTESQLVVAGEFQARPPSMDQGHSTDIERRQTCFDDSPDQMRVIRWKLAAEAVQIFPAISKRFSKPQSGLARHYSEAQRLYPEIPERFVKVDPHGKSDAANYLECPTEELVTERANDWPSDEHLRRTAGLKMGMALWVASMGFGAIHIAAWRTSFPTETEAWLWRVSSTYIVSSGLLWSIINILALTSKVLWWYWFDFLTGQLSRPSYAILGGFGIVCGVAYLCSRIYLIIEVFISLRSLPVAAYAAAEWTISVPHL